MARPIIKPVTEKKESTRLTIKPVTSFASYKEMPNDYKSKSEFVPATSYKDMSKSTEPNLSYKPMPRIDDYMLPKDTIPKDKMSEVRGGYTPFTRPITPTIESSPQFDVRPIIEKAKTAGVGFSAGLQTGADLINKSAERKLTTLLTGKEPLENKPIRENIPPLKESYIQKMLGESKIYEKAKKGELSSSDQVTFELFNATGGIALTAIVGATAGPLAGKGAFFLKASESYRDQALAEGKSKLQASVYSTVMGLAESVVESLGGFKPWSAKSIIAKGIFKNAAGEAVEEAVMPIIEEATKRILFNEKNYNFADGGAKELLKESLISAAYGAAVSILFQGATKGFVKTTRIANKIINNEDLTKVEFEQAKKEINENSPETFEKQLQDKTKDIGNTLITNQQPSVEATQQDIQQPTKPIEQPITSNSQATPQETKDNLKKYLELDKQFKNTKNSEERNKILKEKNKVEDTLTDAEMQVIYKMESDQLNTTKTTKVNKPIEQPIQETKTNKPTKVYHGTDATFDSYSLENFGKHDKGDLGEAIYFATKKETAQKYGRNIKEANISLKNPLILNNGIDYRNMRSKIVKNMDLSILDDFELEMYRDQYVPQWEKDYLLYSKLTPKEKTLAVQKLGYDGIIDNDYGQVAVFNPKQINKPTTVDKTVTPKQNVTYQDGETYNLNEPKKVSMFKNFYRNIRSLFDAKTAKAITGDFDNAKLDYTKRNNKLANSLKKNIVDKYGIKKGSKDSALVQQYGEGIITLDELKTKSSNWQNIVEADKYFREQYDMLIDEINNTRKSIYPNVEATIAEYERKLANVRDQIKLLSKQKNADSGKIANLKLKAKSYEDTLASDDLLRNKRVEKRKDYYRHFQEMAEGFAGLKNILTTSADISPQMVGVSDFTKPKTKFSSIAQRRLGNKTKYDAVGGFLNYIPTANYMISIDPQISKLRTLTKNLREQMGEDTSANKAIEFLNEFTNQLAGKQNFLDRAVTKITGRKAIKGANWLGGRIKSNMILGNASSSISQVLNLPQIVGKIKNPKLLLGGFAKSYTNTDYSQSQFMSERYSSDIYSQFDTGLLKYPKKFAKWMLEALDERVTKTGWNAFYQDAINKNIDNPIQYADDNIRDLVAGRGIGEKTILQESNVINLIAPFTVEVGNLMGVIGDMAKKKEFMSLLITFIASNLLNKAVKKIGGGGSTFDPIDALQDAFTEEDITLLERFGRIAGEVISNTPGGQIGASLYPKYGTKTLPTREKLFGDNDPTRFGTGSIFSKAVENPLTSVITPFGGSQIKKTVEGLKMFDKDIPGSYDKNGKLRFPISPTNLNKIQAAIFGQYASKEAREYFDKNHRALSEKQLDSLKGSDNIKRDYENMMKLREYNSLITKFEELQKAGKDTTKIEKQINDMFK